MNFPTPKIQKRLSMCNVIRWWLRKDLLTINLLSDLLMRYTDMLNKGFGENHLHRLKKNSDNL